MENTVVVKAGFELDRRGLKSTDSRNIEAEAMLGGREKKEPGSSGHESSEETPSRPSRKSGSSGKVKRSSIVLPKAQFEILQERIKTEIENLKYLESTIACDGEARSADDGDENNDEDEEEETEKKEKDEKDEKDEEDEEEDLGSDIQFLPECERKEMLSKKNRDKLSTRRKGDSKLLKTKVNRILAMETERSSAEIVTIDLTDEGSPPPVDVKEKTDRGAGSGSGSEPDLNIGAKIDWGDREKPQGKEKSLVSLAIDRSKLTSETTRKITDIQNRISRSLSIGLGRKEPEGDAETNKNKNIGDSPEDAEIVELSRLRCTSERTEVVADRERRRKRRCADYPGFAFGSSIFSSDTMMKFSIIRNELHNIMNTQLKRVCTCSCCAFRSHRTGLFQKNYFQKVEPTIIAACVASLPTYVKSGRSETYQ